VQTHLGAGFLFEGRKRKITLGEGFNRQPTITAAKQQAPSVLLLSAIVDAQQLWKDASIK
jgi:hypothetical protein